MQPEKPSSIELAFYRYRSFTPVPFVLALWYFADPSPISFLTGVAVVTAGEILRLWSLFHIGSKTRSTCRIRADHLITTGPFAYIRNPLYFGNGLICCGAVIASGTYWLLLVLPALFFFWCRYIIPGEEAFLSGAFGEDFRHYRAAVRRFVPRLTPYRSGRARFRLRDVLPGELNTIVLAQLVLLVLGREWLPTPLAL